VQDLYFIEIGNHIRNSHGIQYTVPGIHTIYLNKEVKTYFIKRASDKNLDLDKVINTILEKEMNLLQIIG
jgi:hypothetical protein